jgi:hypothetical protein
LVLWRGERLKVQAVAFGPFRLLPAHHTAMSTPVMTAKAAQMAMISTFKADMVSSFLASSYARAKTNYA